MASVVAVTQASLYADARGAAMLTDASFSIATVAEDSIIRTVYVDNTNPEASDAGLGTPEIPFQSLSAAVQFADQHVRAGIGTRVIVRPGIYRERVTVAPAENAAAAPLVIEGEQPGTVVISGADIWKGWQRIPGTNTCRHDWPYRWGYVPYPAKWRGQVVLKPIVRRREMILLNGAFLDQVLSPRQLHPGSFYISEETQTIRAEPPRGVDLLASTVEVSVRSPLFQVSGRTNLVLRGLVFRQANTALPDAAVEIADSSIVLIENCEFSWNNGDGLDLLTSHDITIKKSRAVNNGNSGIGGYELRNVLLDSNDTSSNNWRGVKGDYTGWGVAGMKLCRIHNALIQRHLALGNRARGLWLDFDVINVTIQDAEFAQNLRDHVFVEASQGPVSILNSYLGGSETGAGFSGANSHDITISGNTLCNNALAQVQVTGDEDRSVTNWETKTTFNVRSERWTVSGNTIGRRHSSETWLQTPHWPWFLRSLESNWNIWSSSVTSLPFAVGRRSWSLTHWRDATGQDAESTMPIVAPPSLEFLRPTAAAYVQREP